MATLKELQAEVREGVASKKTQLDNLPLECSRIDLVGYTSLPPTQYTLLFPSLKIKDLWEKEFLKVKGAADCKAPPTSSVAPPTSPLPVQVCPSHDLVFQNSIILQSVKSGMQVSQNLISHSLSRARHIACLSRASHSLPLTYLLLLSKHQINDN